MNIEAREVEYTKSVGKWNSKPVIEVGLKGGLFLLFCQKNGKMETIGSGPHRAVARHIAKRMSENEIEFTDLNKADFIEPVHFEHLLPYYEALTAEINEHMQGIVK